MSSPPPTKPPRGVKQGKETSGLLMSVIRTLSASESDEQRDKERRRLERERARSDERLGALVGTHQAALARVAAVAADADAALGAAERAAAGVAARLAAADRLLRPRGPDLSTLWREARSLHHALGLLAAADLLNARERDARDAIAGGRVLRAALLLAEARGVEPPAPALRATVDRLRAVECDLLADLSRRLARALLAEPGGPSPAPHERARDLVAALEAPRTLELDPDAAPDLHDPAPSLAAAVALGELPLVAARFAERLPAELAAVATRGLPDSGAEPAAALEKRLERLGASWERIGARLSRLEPALVSQAQFWAAASEATLAVVRSAGSSEAAGAGRGAAEVGGPALSEQFGRRRASRRGRLYCGGAAQAGVGAGIEGVAWEACGAAVRGVRMVAELAEAGGGGQALRVWASGAARAGSAGARAAARVSALSPATWARPHAAHPSLAAAAVNAWEAVEEAAEWARGAAWCLPEHTDVLQPALDALLRHLHAAADSAGPPRTHPVARLLADEDFARFLCSLPQHRAVLGAPDPPPDELGAALRREADALAAALPAPPEPAPPLRDLAAGALLAESAAWLSERARAADCAGWAARAEEAGLRALVALRLELRAHVMRRAVEADEGGSRVAAEVRSARASLAGLSGARAVFVWRGLGAAAAAAAVRAGTGAEAARRGLRGAPGAGLSRVRWVWGVRGAGAGAACAARAGRRPADVSAADAAAAVLAAEAGGSGGY